MSVYEQQPFATSFVNSSSTLRRERLEKLHKARLYLCTDARLSRGDLESFLDEAYSGGVDIIQLRDKKISVQQELAALEVLKKVARRHDKLFAVNDRADIAALMGADIFHRGQDDLSAVQARRLLGADVLVGASTHGVSQGQEAATDKNIDYFACGPVWPTPTKPGRAATGVEYLEQVAQFAGQKPWFAIGGVNVDTVSEVCQAGASRIVVVRALTEATDVRSAAKQLKGALEVV
ncbi:thiamine phosphate synthase [Rothia sp. P13129]|uniref:thiamine phosphate synthase n=1 Tax=Rothia sp. P13129 TaxID=3402664 RepID=UPI003AC1A3D6